MEVKKDRDVGKKVMKRNGELWEACKIINDGKLMESWKRIL